MMDGSSVSMILSGRADTGEGQPSPVRHSADNIEDLIRLVTDSVPAPNTQRAYARALREFMAWHRQNNFPLSKASVQRYMQTLAESGRSASTINQSLTALRKLATEAADNGLLNPDIAAALGRIRSIPRRGKRTGRWLTPEQSATLISAPHIGTLKGKRDRVILGLLLECGMRRDEAVHVCTDQYQMREGRYIFADVRGKGHRTRTVAVPNRCAFRITGWIESAGLTDGCLIRPINRDDTLGDGSGISTTALYKILKAYAEDLGLSISPHDLRRTFAKLAHTGKAPLEQIQHSLGHSSIRTTEIYLGVRQDLKNAPCDTLNLNDETENNAPHTKPLRRK